VAINLSALNRFWWTVAVWTIAWGLTGALLRLIAIVIQPDTGHVPRYEVPLLLGIPLGLCGVVGGSLFGVLAGSYNGNARVFLGGLVGGIAGVAPGWFPGWRSVALALSIVVGISLGAALSRWYDRTIEFEL
jgi:hypothetical protein